MVSSEIEDRSCLKTTKLMLKLFDIFLTNIEENFTDTSLVKRGTHLGFNAIRVLKKNVLTFCLHKVLIKCRVSTRKHDGSIDSSLQ